MAALNAQQVKLLGFPVLYAHDAFVRDHPAVAAKLRSKVHSLLAELDVKESEIRVQAEAVLRQHEISTSAYHELQRSRSAASRKRSHGEMEGGIMTLPSMTSLVQSDEQQEKYRKLESDNDFLRREVSNLLVANTPEDASPCRCSVAMREDLAALRTLLKEYQRERDAWRGRYMAVAARVEAMERNAAAKTTGASHVESGNLPGLRNVDRVNTGPSTST